jgi:hypothetical protein
MALIDGISIIVTAIAIATTATTTTTYHSKNSYYMLIGPLPYYHYHPFPNSRVSQFLGGVGVGPRFLTNSQVGGFWC